MDQTISICDVIQKHGSTITYTWAYLQNVIQCYQINIVKALYHRRGCKICFSEIFKVNLFQDLT